MQKYVKYLIAISIFITANLFSQSQEQKPKYWLGLGGLYSAGLNKASFEKLPNTPNCCSEFNSTIGSGIYLDGIFYYNIKNDFYLDTRLSFVYSNANFTETGDPIGNVIDPITNEPVNAIVNHNLETALMLLSLNPQIAYEFPFKLKLMAGIDIGYMVSSNFSQSEEITEPANYVFMPDETLTRNVVDSRAIDELNPFQFGLTIGAAYKLSLGNEKYLTPEIKYIHRLTDVTSVDWNFNELRVGISYFHPIFDKIEQEIKRDTIFSRDTTDIFVYKISEDPIKLSSRDYTTNVITDSPEIFAEETVVNELYTRQVLKDGNILAKVEAFGLETNGSKTKYPKIIIEETEKEEAFPVLPYVFFEIGTDKFRDTKMISNLDSFIEDSLKPDVYEIYRNNLNILANRAIGSDATLTLTSINPIDTNNSIKKEIIDSRIDKTVEYLEKLGVPSNKIKVNSKKTEIRGSGTDLKDLVEEANRIEITSSDQTNLEPVFIKQIERTANPPAIELRLKAEADAGLDKWNLTVSQNEELLREYSGNNEAETLKWEIIKEPSPKLEKPIDINLEVNDVNGNSNTDSESLQLNQLTLKKKRYELENDKRIQKFSLIVFDYNSAELKPIHKQIISEIKSRIEDNSTIRILGYADRVGEDNYNYELSQKRMENVKKELESLPNTIETKAYGNRIEVYNNNLPEGRSLSRTVQIIIKTPFEDE